MKIFVIGGHKNGTLCLHEWFLKRGYKSIHGEFWSDHQKIIDENDCFLDHFAELGNYRKISYLNQTYPDSLFILNYRNLDDYINSLIKHLLNGCLNNYNSKNRDYWAWDNNEYSLSKRIINTHLSNNYISNYFKNNNLLNKLLIINICNGKNKENTIKLEKFLNLQHNEDIILEKINHDLLPLSDKKIYKYYKIFKNEIINEKEMIRKKITTESYLNFLI